MKSIYKNQEAKRKMMALYDEKLQSLQIEYQSRYLETRFGKTHVITTGNEQAAPLILLHGINAGAPLTLEAIKNLGDAFCLHAIDTPGQTTRSDENRINIKGPDFAEWLHDVMQGLGIEKAHFIGVSYGAFILQKMMTYYPEKIRSAVFVVPAGLCNGPVYRSFVHLTIPLIRFLLSKKDRHLARFLSAFSDAEAGSTMFEMQKIMLLETYMDYRRPGLLKKQDVANYKSPLYVVVAADDVFFPGDKAIQRCREIFSNVQDVHILKTSKHMPNASCYPAMEARIREWLRDIRDEG
ncbi:MAG: alpha/beta hydrolase [Cyclobacteriaceae bacterium]|nr:alpha/beta hydrolase [Cyclobacteriaceae bacterium]